MPRFLINVHHPHGDQPDLNDPKMHEDIDALNDAMVEAGVRVYVGGLYGPDQAVTLKRSPNGDVQQQQGLHLTADEYVAGLWVLEVDSMEQAIEWARKAADACRRSIEVRPFH